jgi:hypothetical protein
MRNDDLTAPGDDLRNAGMIPATSQIPNNSNVVGQSLNDVLNSIQATVGARGMVKVAGLIPATVTDEKNAAIGGDGSNQFTPFMAIVHLSAVDGATPTGDFHITIGTSTGGTQILASTECTGLLAKDGRFVIAIAGLRGSILDNASIYVKIVTADTTAEVGTIADVYLYGESFPKAV